MPEWGAPGKREQQAPRWRRPVGAYLKNYAAAKVLNDIWDNPNS
jgi:hypothetical protein